MCLLRTLEMWSKTIPTYQWGTSKMSLNLTNYHAISSKKNNLSFKNINLFI